LNVLNLSNQTTESYTNLCHTYTCPSGYTYGGNAKTYLTGAYNFKVEEIEVYRLIV